MDKVSGKLTVYFEEPFWVGVFERIEDGKLFVAKVTFGAEPKDYEVHEYIPKYYLNMERKVDMKDKNILISMGIIIYIVISGIDKFVYHIPNVIYIPLAILGIAMILIGFFKGKSK